MDIGAIGVVFVVGGNQNYLIFLRLNEGLVSENSEWVGIAGFIFRECFKHILGNAHPTNFLGEKGGHWRFRAVKVSGL